jgi:hypothetical protein
MLIQIDFSKVNRVVAEYLRGEIKKKAINRDSLIALLNAFEGIQFPGALTAITDKADVNYEEIKEKIYAHNDNLSKAIARLEFWFSINRTIGNELSNEETVKNKAATILAQCL